MAGSHAASEKNRCCNLSEAVVRIDRSASGRSFANAALRCGEGQTLQQLYDERVPLYERYADITVDCENKSIREIVAEIVARLPK